MQKLRMNVKALVNIVPKGSQVVPLSFVMVGALCLACTCFFVWKGVDYVIPLVAAVVLLVVAALMWIMSAQRVDDASIPPVNITSTDGVNSTAISLHHRALPALQNAHLLERLLLTVQHRKPLPEPDGLVDKDGIPVPHSQNAAQKKVEAANQQAQRGIDEILSLYQMPQNQQVPTQSSTDCGPEITEVGKFNASSDESDDS